jgi:hypothetical protein
VPLAHGVDSLWEEEVGVSGQFGGASGIKIEKVASGALSPESAACISALLTDFTKDAGRPGGGSKTFGSSAPKPL